MDCKGCSLRACLEEIAALENVTQSRGPLEHLSTPSHLVDEDGWGPIDPTFKRGLSHAARIARSCLNNSVLVI